ncbi:MAG: hypothetical protein KDB82_14130 [Planctomycetes bacterium]|nr:hypothetical protein [Planctomycetota bacterium]
MFKLDKLLSFIVVASLVGALLAPIAGMIAKPGPGATQFMFGLIAASGFLVALSLSLGVIVNIAQSKRDSSDQS